MLPSYISNINKKWLKLACREVIQILAKSWLYYRCSMKDKSLHLIIALSMKTFDQTHHEVKTFRFWRSRVILNFGVCKNWFLLVLEVVALASYQFLTFCLPLVVVPFPSFMCPDKCKSELKIVFLTLCRSWQYKLWP